MSPHRYSANDADEHSAKREDQRGEGDLGERTKQQIDEERGGDGRENQRVRICGADEAQRTGHERAANLIQQRSLKRRVEGNIDHEDGHQTIIDDVDGKVRPAVFLDQRPRRKE